MRRLAGADVVGTVRDLGVRRVGRPHGTDALQVKAPHSRNSPSSAPQRPKPTGAGFARIAIRHSGYLGSQFGRSFHNVPPVRGGRAQAIFQDARGMLGAVWFGEVIASRYIPR